MGWTSQRREKGTTNEEFFLSGFEEGTVFHACGTVNGTFYAAVEKPSMPGEVWAYVALTHWSPREYYNFTYKDMSEASGPCHNQAPEKVLKALTATDSDSAKEWREAVSMHHAQRKALRGLRDGDKITLSSALNFSNGATLSEFTIRRRAIRGGSTKVALSDGYQTYRLHNWQNMVLAVIRDGVSTPTPLAEFKPENTYVNEVSELAWSILYKKDPTSVAVREAMVERYGSADPSTVSVGARAEFREGRTWEALETFIQAA